MRLAIALIWLLAVSGRAEVVWRDAATLTLEGRGWADVVGPYDRLPRKAQATVPASVWGLSKHSAGVAVRFVTDSPEVSVRWSLTGDGLAMPHMPATGVSGVDLYRREPSGKWRFIGNGRPTQPEGNTARFAVGPGGARDYRLYLPLYNGASSVEIGVPDGAEIRPGQASAPEARIVYYGTSIAQGGCASRPGTAHVAIMGRLLDREMVNLGFSGSGRMEPEVAALIAEIPAAAYVVDCLWNMGGLDEPEIGGRIKSLVATIRKRHRDTPIVFVGQSHMDPAAHPTRLTKVQEQAVKDLRERGFTGLHLIGGAGLIGSDGEGTVDGCHPTDLGMMRQAYAMAPTLRSILRAVSKGR